MTRPHARLHCEILRWIGPILWALDVPRMPAITTVCLNALVGIQEVNKDFIEDCNVVVLPSRVWTLDPYQVASADANAELIPKG